MSREEDPEARIRQLEQSAAQYGAVELGTEQYTSSQAADPTAQLPPPVYGTPPAYGAPPAYGDPYSAPPFGVSYLQVQKKGAPVGLVFGIIAVFVVILFGVVGVVVWNVTKNVGSISTREGGETTFGRPGGSFEEPGTARPTGSAPTVLPTGEPSPEVVVAPAGGQYSVSGVDEFETVDCNGSNISVSGVNNTVTLLGHCLSVSVSGVENKVTVDSADHIGASGFDNEVIYHSGTPQIDATSRNSVAQG